MSPSWTETWRAQQARREAAEVKELIQEDRDAARYPGLAERLSRAGIVKGKKGRVYLRMGELPMGGRRSLDSGAGWVAPELEDGTSVFAGRLTRERHYILQAPFWFWGWEIVRLFEEGDRPAYFVKGRRVGIGGSHEPLLRNIGYFEPVPPECIVAAEPASRAVEDWNIRRGGPFEERPELAEWFRERSE